MNNARCCKNVWIEYIQFYMIGGLLRVEMHLMILDASEKRHTGRNHRETHWCSKCVTDTDVWKSESWVKWGFTPTWKELNSRSQKRRMRRSMEPLGTDSSMTKVKRMAWIPSRGMRVRVDFANLDQRRKGNQGMVVKIKCDRRPDRSVTFMVIW